MRLTEWPDTGAGKVAEPLTPHRTVLLDERGKALASEAFADLLRRHLDGGTADMAFLIGGPDGHAPELREALLDARRTAEQPAVVEVLVGDRGDPPRRWRAVQGPAACA